MTAFCVYLYRKFIIQLGIFNGDAVLLKGKKRKDTVCIALVEEGLEDSSIRMSKVRALCHSSCAAICTRSRTVVSDLAGLLACIYGDKSCWRQSVGAVGVNVCEAFRPSARFRVSLSVPRVLVCWYCHELFLVPHTTARTDTCTRRVDTKYLHTAYSTAYSTPNSAFGTHLQYTDNHPMDDGWWVMDDGR